MPSRDETTSGLTVRGPEMVKSYNAATPVVALHCSGGDGRQWKKMSDLLPPGAGVIAPSLIGTESTGHWHGQHAFSLADEAALIVDMIDELASPVHLVGHSYGGAVALKVALERPQSIASLSLYEPSAFHILRQPEIDASLEMMEIEALADRVTTGVTTGAYQSAAEHFVEYWNGKGTWSAMRPALREAMVKWLPKAPLDFRALVHEDVGLSAYRRLTCPVLLMVGQHARLPSRTIACRLAEQIGTARLSTVYGAGHMGPITHADAVNNLVLRHIRSCEAGTDVAWGAVDEAA